jgi:ABC-type transport system involved in cytochrome c biogenesis permease component
MDQLHHYTEIQLSLFVISPMLSLLLNCNVATDADSYTLLSYLGNNELAIVAKVKAPFIKMTIDQAPRLNGTCIGAGGTFKG